ncbi:hypothetical protein FA15DRAFT_600059 [Coprinopsis marcescibilis]|uniref:Fungal-type protein kinase domain-containing protein n=1 Tax=Coprinopsis marcescibilis TaxID=230819 RepID=A0A5C3KK67_COPMA|nr:hypothetical protein FA15DRAFT_600059 [Coprinopsis marcescibilis]
MSNEITDSLNPQNGDKSASLEIPASFRPKFPIAEAPSIESTSTNPQTPPQRKNYHPKVSTLQATKKAHTGGYSTNVTETPHTDGCGIVADGKFDVEEQKEMIKNELARHTVCSQDFGFELFKNVASERDIKKYLAKSTLYNNRKREWTSLAEKPITAESQIYTPVLDIFKDVLNWFNRSVDKKSGVVAKLCANTRLAHQEDVPNKQSSSPDFAIMGFGPSFVEEREEADGPTYVSSLASWEGKLDSVMGSVSPHINQVGVYARQIYNHQPNRNFVRSVVISEKRVRLLQYDRSGVKHSEPYDFHKQPTDFIRLVLGLTSEDPKLVGFDDSIRWESAQGSTDSPCGTITTVDKNKNPVTYKIVGKQPSFQRRSLIGRATSTWDVIGPEGEEYLIKDSWRAKGRASEHEFLEAARGVVGVAQLVAFEEICKVSDFRDLQEGESESLIDRTKCRLTLERYGPPIENFRSASQALWALHDAIQAHKELFKAGVLHRDISKNNILLGRPNAEDGWRGVLIDMDMGLWRDPERNPAADFRTGTRMFQSVMVLTSFYDKAPQGLCHDHYDDLESFLYVLCYLTFWYVRADELREEAPSPLRQWDNNDPETSCNSKYKFIMNRSLYGTLEDRVSDYWGEPCKNLIKRFQEIIRYIVEKKEAITERNPLSLETLRNEASKHYADVLQCFKEAIAEVEKAEAEGAANPLTVPVVPSAAVLPAIPRCTLDHRMPISPSPLNPRARSTTSINNKRASEDPLEEEQPVIKSVDRTKDWLHQ